VSTAVSAGGTGIAADAPAAAAAAQPLRRRHVAFAPQLRLRRGSRRELNLRDCTHRDKAQRCDRRIAAVASGAWRTVCVAAAAGDLQAAPAAAVLWLLLAASHDDCQCDCEHHENQQRAHRECEKKLTRK